MVIKRKSDNEKLDDILKEMVDNCGEFSSEMVYDYILNRDIKFKKDISTKKIGYYISTSGKFEKFRNKNKNYYKVKEGVIL